MRRREFISLLAGAAVVWPLPLNAQSSGRLPTIGVLGTTAAPVWSPWNAAFVQRLRELGWIEGRTVAIEYRWSEGRRERFAEIAAEFVRLKVDVIVTAGSAVATVKQATSVIPIVFAIAIDPVAGGLVASLARPGGNVTGLSNQQSDLAGKRIGLLREALPDLRRLAILANAGYPESVLEMREVEAIARNLGMEVSKVEIRRLEDIAPFDALKGRADALYVVVDGLVSAHRARILAFALAARLPAIVNIREHLLPGALLSYGPNFPDLFRRSAEIVDKILRGTKPADIPVEQPTKFDLVVNLTTAKALGLTVPPTLLLRADEVIE
jgi:putative ABC transport system substrate-binding protein